MRLKGVGSTLREAEARLDMISIPKERGLLAFGSTYRADAPRWKVQSTTAHRRECSRLNGRCLLPPTAPACQGASQEAVRWPRRLPQDPRVVLQLHRNLSQGHDRPRH